MRHDATRHSRLGAIARRNLLTACLAFSGLAVMIVRVEESPRRKAPHVSQASLLPGLSAAEVLIAAPSPEPEVIETALEAPVQSPLDFAISLLEVAQARIHGVGDYSARFIQHEEVNGVLGDVNEIHLKVRHEPFSVYMGWIEPYEGREVIYVDGHNDNRLLAHEGGWKRLLVPMVRLDPFGHQAMKTSRHPITEIGIAYLTDRLLEERILEKSIPTVEVIISEESDRDGRACWRFEHWHKQPDGTEYGRVIYHLDKELGLPVACQTFDWPADDATEGGLVESYFYGDLELDPGLSDLDFDCENPEYGFQRL